MNNSEAIKYLKNTPIFTEKITVERFGEGLSNYSFLVTCNNKRFVAKFLNNLLLFHTTHLQEIAANKAAHKLDIAPQIMHYDNKVIIFEYIQSKNLTNEEIKEEKTLKKIIDLLKIVHKKIPYYFRGPVMINWNFYSVKDYAKTLRKINSPHIEKLNNFLKDIVIFEDISGPFDIVFTHGDFFLPNILTDGKRLWLVDWEYSGFNSPLSDLGSLSKHGRLNQEQDNFILEQYYEATITSKLKHQFHAIKCSSLLKELLWSMIAEIKPPIDYDFREYTKGKLDDYRRESEKFFNY
tara:strand:- start:204 stop:1085 length:882 start_codon:yes stop_codon:yes gene_type:complete